LLDLQLNAKIYHEVTYGRRYDPIALEGNQGHKVQENKTFPGGAESSSALLSTYLISASLGLIGFACGVPYVPGITDNIIVGIVLGAAPIFYGT
jgi:hypothetical protein